MRAYSLNELFCLTRAELFALHAQIVNDLPGLRYEERATAIETLRRIRRTLAHVKFGP